MADEVQTEEATATAASETATQEAQPPTVEDLARELKWRPKDEWTGPEEEWRDAAEFIRAGQHGKLVTEVKSLKAMTERMARTAAKETARMLAEQETEITARFEQAVEDGDKAAAAQATRDLAKVQAERNQPDDAVTAFAARNPWYGADMEATDYAAVISDRLAKAGKSPAEQCDEVESLVRKRFPELFEEAERPRPKAPVVSAPSTRSSTAQKRAKGAADLPATAKQAGEEFVRMATERGRTYTIDDYARTYWSEQGDAA